MTHKMQMRRLNKFIQFKLMESFENGKMPVLVKEIMKRKKARRSNVILAGKRACKKVPFPTERIYDENFPKEFKPITGWKPSSDPIEWIEDNNKRRFIAEGVKEIYNQQVKKAKETKLITGRKENQLLLPM